MNTTMAFMEFDMTTTYSDVFNYSNNTSASNETPQLMPDSLVERTGYSIIIITLCLIIIPGNISLIRVLHTFNLCQKSSKIIRTVIAVVDICIGINATTGMLSIVFGNRADENYKVWMCHTNGLAGEMLVYASMLCIAIFSVERYVYMAHPLQYIKWMRPKIIVIALVMFFSFVLAYGISTQVIYGRKQNIATMTCQLQNNWKSGAVIIMPAVIVSLIVIILFAKLRNDLLKNDPNQLSMQQNNQTLSGSGISKKSFLKLMKTVILLSGSLWLSLVPALIIRVTVNQFFTLAKLEGRPNMYAFTTMRLSNIMIGLGTSAFNPMIQFWLEEDLRVGFLRGLGIRKDFSWQRQHKETFQVERKRNTVLVA